jgi:cytochrome c-type biogenesis protein CcmE
MSDGQKAFIIVAILVAGGALAWLSFGGIGDNLVYYWTPTEMSDHGDEAVGAQIRLGGVVEKDSLKWDKTSNELLFRVSDGTNSVLVEGRSVPPQMFREEVGVVVEGTLRPDGVFVSDRLLVKHDNQYKAPEDGSAPDMDALRQSMTPES